MRPKGKLFALVAVFAAIAVVTASGAFTTATAQRTATVNLSGDGSALLQMESSSTYVDTTGDTLSINFENDSAGLNVDATFEFDSLFTVTNQGTQPVKLNISDDAETSTFADEDAFVIYNGTNTNDPIETSGQAVTLNPGEALQVGIKVDTTGLSSTESGFDVTMNVTANAI